MQKQKYDREYNLIMFFAFRYALGRMTYAPSAVSKFIKKNIKKIDDQSIGQMIDEIHYASERKGLGWDCDQDTWLNFSIYLENVLLERQNDLL